MKLTVIYTQLELGPRIRRYKVFNTNKPTHYERNGEIHDNTYQDDSHPNDKRANYKKGESKGRMIGLEEAGWKGYKLIEKVVA